MREDSLSTRAWWLHPLVLAIAGGLLLAASFSFFPFILLIALLPCFELEYQLKEKRHTLSFGALIFLSMLLFNAMGLRLSLQANLTVGMILVASQALAMTLPFLLYRVTKNVINEAYGFFSFALYWLSFEYLNLHSAYGWPHLVWGNVWVDYPAWVQWYEVTGVLGGTLWVLCTNIWIYLALRSYFPISRRAFGLYAALVFAIVFVYSLYLRPSLDKDSHQFSIHSPNLRDLPEGLGKIAESTEPRAVLIKNHESDSDSAAKSAITESWYLFQGNIPSDTFYFFQTGASMISKEAIFIPRTNALLQQYGTRGNAQSSVYDAASLLRGRLPGLQGEDPDCYLYAEILDDNLLGSQDILYALATFRALETRRYILVSFRDGSCQLVDPQGKSRFIDYRPGNVLFEGPYPPNRTTLYALHGDYIGRLAWFLAIALFLSGLVRQKTRRKPAQ